MLDQCRFGYGFSRVDDERVTMGLIPQLPSPNSKLRHRYRNSPSERVRAEEVTRAVEAARALGVGFVESLEIQEAEAIRQLGTNPAAMHAALEKLRKDFDQNLSQSHDFLQLLNQIRGHAETLLRLREPTMDVHHAAEKHFSEGAIYFASELMRLKVDALVYVEDPARALEETGLFEIHPLVLKYVRIYDWQARQKELDLRLEGECRERVRYRNDAIGAVIQGLLDNMIKYAPARSRATVRFDVTPQRVRIGFSSLGPRLMAGEDSKIWLPGFRGKVARELEPLGQGIGLGTVRSVLDAVSGRVSVEQADDPDQRFPAHYLTTFSVELDAVGP
ncbi:HAMP domain-containing sensor histidine kinase [Agrococcus lahaulensis]|uniref:HAMP domain-containing sensor histidine kinase n=1 Tax=Agrococcus lahaulensis TaxID=341722 RepID=UPI0012EBA0B3|nr:HAMP domain-containing sensor histidine kinase [Agrococcus lahaulensis]